MFTKSAAFYDAIYSDKDYETESRRLHALIQEHKQSNGMTFLDVACGTGKHITYLQQQYDVEGLDLDPDLLAIARERHPDLAFHETDMVNFDLGCQFDVITCLFSAIGYVMPWDRMCETVHNMARHLKSGGVLVVEPWLTPETLIPGPVSARFVDEPNFKIARMSVTKIVDGNVSVFDFHYMVATPEGVAYFTECHKLVLYTHAEYVAAFEDSRLYTVYDKEGLTGRGLYIGIK